MLHHKRSQLSADEAGFTLIEVLVASSVLVIALLGLFLMVDVAAKTSRVTAGREGAVNLAREITEDARAVPYAQITSSGIVSQLQSMPGLANQSGGGSWQIVRRGVTYTITVTESDLAAVTNQTIPQKQVSVAVSWTVSGVTHSFSEIATMSSAAQGVGLAASNVQWSNAPGTGWSGTVSQPTISSTSITSMLFSVQTPLTATGVQWTVNGVIQPWTATVTATTSSALTWTVSGATPWSMGTLSDQSYQIGAAAQNGGVTGPAVAISVKLARQAPTPPTFQLAGFNSVKVSGTATPVAELDWTGSNPGEPQVVGYRITNAAATIICQTTLTSQTNSLSYPANCGINGASVWCLTPTACIDFGPASTTSTTYTVAPLYFDANNTLQPGTGTSVQLKSSSSPTYSLTSTAANTGTNCPFAGAHDLNANYTAGATDSTGTTSPSSFCGPAFTSPGTISGGATGNAYFTTGNGKSCNVTGSLSLNGSSPLTSSLTVPGNTFTPTAFPFSWSFAGNVSANVGDRVDVSYSWNCTGNGTLILHYGATSTPSQVNIGSVSVVAPSPPTGLAVTTNADGSATVRWTAPNSGTAVWGYRIYRDGNGYANRYDDDTTADLCTSGSCTWIDYGRTGSHTYYVTAVGPTAVGSNAYESTIVGPVTG